MYCFFLFCPSRHKWREFIIYYLHAQWHRFDEICWMSTLLKHLHWLPVSACIHFKIALLTFKSLHTIAPSYLSSLIQPYVPSRALRSSSAQRLCVPRVSSVFGSRGFRSAGPAIWNSLPLSVSSCSTIHTFKKQLKTHLFASAFPSSWIVLDAPLIRWPPLIYLSGCLWFCACLNVCYYYYKITLDFRVLLPAFGLLRVQRIMNHVSKFLTEEKTC